MNKVIGINGRGGCGKTAVSKIICKNSPGSCYIEVDSVIENKILGSLDIVNEAQQIFSMQLSMADIISAYFNTDNLSNQIHQFFCFCVEREIKKRMIYDNTLYIVDWYELHELPSFESMVDYKVLLTAPYELRVERAYNRKSNIDIFKKVDEAYKTSNNCNYNMIFDTSMMDANCIANQILAHIWKG